MKPLHPRWWTTGALLPLLVLGCSKSKPTVPEPAPAGPKSYEKLKGIGGSMPAVGRLEPEVLLQQFGQLYMAEASGGKPPKRLEDMPELQRDSRPVYEAIKDGAYIVSWGADPTRAPLGTNRTVLACVKDAPVRGGVALFLDGSVRNAKAEEIQAGLPRK